MYETQRHMCAAESLWSWCVRANLLGVRRSELSSRAKGVRAGGLLFAATPSERTSSFFLSSRQCAQKYVHIVPINRVAGL